MRSSKELDQIEHGFFLWAETVLLFVKQKAGRWATANSSSGGPIAN